MNKIIILESDPAVAVINETLLTKRYSGAEILKFSLGEDLIKFLDAEIADEEHAYYIFMEVHLSDYHGLELIEYIEDLDFEEKFNLNIYLVTQDNSVLLKEKLTAFPVINAIIYKPLLQKNLPEIAAEQLVQL